MWQCSLIKGFTAGSEIATGQSWVFFFLLFCLCLIQFMLFALDQKTYALNSQKELGIEKLIRFSSSPYRTMNTMKLFPCLNNWIKHSESVRTRHTYMVINYMLCFYYQRGKSFVIESALDNNCQYWWNVDHMAHKLHNICALWEHLSCLPVHTSMG